MEIVARELEQLNWDIAAHSAEVKAAQEAWLNAEDLGEKAILKVAYEGAREKEEQLWQIKQALIAKLPSQHGEPTLPQHVVSSMRQYGICRLVCDWSSESLEASAGQDVSPRVRAAQIMCICLRLHGWRSFLACWWFWICSCQPAGVFENCMSPGCQCSS